MGGGCTKSARVGVDDPIDTTAALRHVRRAVALSSAGNSLALQRELSMLLEVLQPSKAHPYALNQMSRSLTFASMLTEDAEESDEEAPDETVVAYLRETLEGNGAHSHDRGARLVDDAVGGKAAGEAPGPDLATASSSSLWVLPEAMARCLSGELLAEPLVISEAARGEALACLDTWDYDTLALHEASGGHSLLLVGEALLESHQLYEPCHVDPAVARRFLRALEACYGDNCYHNAMHGADVALGVHRFLVKFGLVARLTKLQLLAAIIGAIVHDFNHPGTNNGHEVRARTERARTHADSVLERHHLHSTFTLLATPAFDLFGGMPADDRDACRKLISEVVLATDLAKHYDTITTLRALAAEHGAAATATAAAAAVAPRPHHGGMLRRSSYEGPLGSQHASSALKAGDAAMAEWRSPFHTEALVGVPLLLGVAIKFADLGHCFKPLGLHKQWTERVTEEFWALGDHERSSGVSLSPLCDRKTDIDVPKSQVGFFKFVCIPFYSVVADLIDPSMLPWLRAQANLQAWQLHGGTFKPKLRATGQAALLSRSISSVGTTSVRTSAANDADLAESNAKSTRRRSVAF